MTRQLPEVPFTRRHSIYPAPELQELLDDGKPVVQVRAGAGKTGYLVLRFEDVRAGLADPRLRAPGSVGPQAEEYGVPAIFGAPGNLMGIDGSEHRRLRDALAPAFSARRMNAIRPRVQEIVNEMVDAIAAKGPPADLHSALSFALPVQVNCELLGVPYEDRDRFIAWADALLMAEGGDPMAGYQAWMEMSAYLGGLLAGKRAEPVGDLLSDLGARVEDGRLSEEEAVRLGAGVLVAGHETTGVQIEYAIVGLLRHPDQKDLLLAEPDLAAQAAEEALRIFPIGIGSTGHQRFAAEDMEIAGTPIPEGSFVLLCFPSAALDPDRFGADPHRFDITRKPGPHMAFGHGPHICPGTALARIELEIVLRTLVTRLPELRFAVPADEVPARKNVMTGGFVELPVTWSPQA